MHAIRTENFSSVEITTEHDLWVWLSNNFGSKDSVWLITYKKSTPQKYLSREQVLDALIAYGWIDGIRRKLDDQRTMQLISQRKTQSWSATYTQRSDRSNLFRNLPTIIQTQHLALAKIRKNRKYTTKTFEHFNASNKREPTTKAFLGFHFALYCVVEITAYSDNFHTGFFQICLQFPSAVLC
jgi:hypothetical protein